jgi:hypothetical protein
MTAIYVPLKDLDEEEQKKAKLLKQQQHYADLVLADFISQPSPRIHCIRDADYIQHHITTSPCFSLLQRLGLTAKPKVPRRVSSAYPFKICRYPGKDCLLFACCPSLAFRFDITWNDVKFDVQRRDLRQTLDKIVHIMYNHLCMQRLFMHPLWWNNHTWKVFGRTCEVIFRGIRRKAISGVNYEGSVICEDDHEVADIILMKKERMMLRTHEVPNIICS